MYMYYIITACLKVQSKTTAIKPKILKFSERLQKISVLPMIFKVPPKTATTLHVIFKVLPNPLQYHRGHLRSFRKLRYYRRYLRSSKGIRQYTVDI